MTIRLIAVSIAAGILIFGRTATAASRGYLYVTDRSVMEGAAPGTVVPGIPNVRRLASFDLRSQLTPHEQATIQPSVAYRSLFVPNDPQFSLQWNLQTMNVPAAWDVDQTAPRHGGDPRIIVAVLDTGLASTLVGGSTSVSDVVPSTVWTNPNEVAGDGIDNDGNGYIDDIHGWNFVSNNARPADDNGHGTHISGVIAAGTDNAVATAGIASNTTIMPLKVLDGDGLGSTETLTAAITFAVQHGANIINLSLGGDEDDPIFHQTIQDAVQKGVIVIAAAGNSGAGTVTYPAQYSEVIGVGATNTDGTRAAYSNYGSALTLVAPGGDTNVDLNNDGQPDGVPSQTCTTPECTEFATIYLSGTSQAASEVSGVAALLESCGVAPGNVKTLLTSSARDLGAVGRDDVFGYGQVDASAALAAAGCVTTAPPPPSAITATASASSNLAIVAKRPSPYKKPVFTWSGQSGATFFLTWKKGSMVIKQHRQTASIFSPTISDEAGYTLSVATVDALGQTSSATTFSYRYQKSVVVVSNGPVIELLKSDLNPLRTITTSIGKMINVSAGTLSATAARIIAAVQPQGAAVSLMDTRGKIVRTVKPFGSNFNGTISSTVLQKADGTSMFVVATNTNGSSLAWYSASGKLLGKNSVYAKSGGLNISRGDVNGDGSDELIVSQVRGAEIRVYSSDRERISLFTPRGKTFKQGWSITAGDVNRDGRAEIIATPNIAAATAKVLILDSQGKELRQWSIPGSKTGPMLLQAIDLTGDGVVEILSAPQSGAGVLQQRSGTGKLLKQIPLTNTMFRSLTSL